MRSEASSRRAPLPSKRRVGRENRRLLVEGPQKARPLAYELGLRGSSTAWAGAARRRLRALPRDTIAQRESTGRARCRKRDACTLHTPKGACAERAGSMTVPTLSILRSNKIRGRCAHG